MYYEIKKKDFDVKKISIYILNIALSFTNSTTNLKCKIRKMTVRAEPFGFYQCLTFPCDWHRSPFIMLSVIFCHYSYVNSSFNTVSVLNTFSRFSRLWNLFCLFKTGEQFHYFMFSKHIKVIEFYWKTIIIDIWTQNRRL